MTAPEVLLLSWTGLAVWSHGQIWLLQIVVYPLFARVGETEYVTYHRYYSRRIPLPVILPGFATFLAPVPLALWGPAVPAWMSAANIAAGLVGLLVAVLLEIPRHAQLESRGRDAATIAELVRFNWPRTISITVQAIVALRMLGHVLAAR